MHNRHNAQHATYTPGKDSQNSPVDKWGPFEDVSVYGWSPADTVSSPEQGRDAVTTRLTLMLPPDAPPCGHRDRWRLLGVTYEQDGDYQDWSNGPFGFKPGGTCHLVKVS